VGKLLRAQPLDSLDKIELPTVEVVVEVVEDSVEAMAV
jgi:hypothetical protein